MTQFWAVVVGLLYVIAMVIVRINFVAFGIRRTLQAEITSLQANIVAEQDMPTTPAPEVLISAKEIKRLLDYSTALISKKFWDARSEFIFWNGSIEVEAWKLVHDAEQLQLFILSPAVVDAQLRRTRADLNTLADAEKATWSMVIARHLDERGARTNTPEAEVRADLSSVMAFLYDREDARMSQLISLLNKVMWLILIGLLLMGAIVFAQPEAIVVLFAGAIGGILSRSRRIYIGTSETTYGATWAPIFISPIVGALTAWAGIFLLVLGQKVGVIDLKQVLPSPFTLATAIEPPLVGLAILLGFAEPLFDSVTGLIGNKVAPGATTNPPPSANNGPSNTAQLSSTPRNDTLLVAPPASPEPPPSP